MARYENKFMKRFTCEETGTDTFEMERGKVSYDLSKMKILHSGIDTIRQLYSCVLKQDVLRTIARLTEECSYCISSIGGIDWEIKRQGKSSGYQYSLKNIDEGVVVLLKSAFKEEDKGGSHIKIEATPQLIDELGLSKLSKRLREIGKIFGETLCAQGVAIHLCVDVKGLNMPEQWDEELVTRSRKITKAKGASNFTYHAASVAFQYGDKETYTFGPPSGIQFSLYNKSKEAVKSDKIDFCESLWKRAAGRFGEVLYDDGRISGEADEVHRFEVRIHHSIIQEFEQGNLSATTVLDDDGNQISSGNLTFIREARDLKRHLQGLWTYFLKSFRLHHSSVYVHPIWQKLSEDVQFSHLDEKFIYKRAKKTPGINTRRSVAMILGYLVKLCTRKRINMSLITSSVLNGMRHLGLEAELANYFGVFMFGQSQELEDCVHEFVHNKYREHIINGVAA